MSLQDQFERILGRLHEAALGDVQWTVPASMINEFIRTHATNLVIYEGRSPSRCGILPRPELLRQPTPQAGTWKNDT